MTSTEIIVHVYADLPVVIEFPMGVPPEEMIRFRREAEEWVEGRSVLVSQGFAVVVCDHRIPPGSIDSDDVDHGRVPVDVLGDGSIRKPILGSTS